MTPQLKSLQDIRKLAASELSLKARLGYVALLLVASGGAIGLLALWFTEAHLPARTQIAFGAMTLICVSWVALSAWALTTRRVLLARDRLIGGYMSVAFTALFLAGTIVAVLTTGQAAAFGAAASGGVMFLIALRVLAVARQRFAALSARRAELANMGGAR